VLDVATDPRTILAAGAATAAVLERDATAVE
jgi:preprotein translocase subunit Sec61beta